MDNFLYLDCFSGISGDMMVGALLDLGLDLDVLKKELKKLPMGGYRISLEDTRSQSLAAKRFIVAAQERQNRNYRDIKKLLSESKLEQKIKADSLDMFKILATAEARVHGCPTEEVHFHEVGAVDSIVDIVCTAIGLNKLGITGFYSSSIPLGRGTLNSAHGKIPIPAPAVLEILKGIPVYSGPFEFEVTTPTGATIVKKYVQKFGALPPAAVKSVGTGAGSRQQGDIPNVLRLVLFNLHTDSKSTEVKLLSANIDDISPEVMGYVCEQLLDKGALDAWVENILMKKGRPAFKLCALVDESREQEFASFIFSQTTTLGIRSLAIGRHCLQREVAEVELSYGLATIKLGYLKGKLVTAEPEYRSCVSLARQSGKPLKQVYLEVKQAYNGRQ